MAQTHDDPLQEVMKLFFICGHEMQRSTVTAWGNLELTAPQLKVLFILEFKGQATIGKIAEALGVGQPTASHLVDRLVQAGLARRVESPTDRRYTLTDLTESGKMMVRRLQQGSLDRLQNCLAQLDEQDLAALRQGLQSLVRVLQATSIQEPVACPFQDVDPK